MELGFSFNVSNFIIVITTVVFFLYLYLNKKVQYWKDHGINCQTNSVWSIFVGLYKFKNTPMHLLVPDVYKKCGRIYGIYMGFKPQLAIAEPHILRNILVKDFNMFHNRMKFKVGNPIFDKMLSILEDDDWKRIRCIMSPTFTSSRMRKMAYLIKECADKFSENVKKMVESSKEESIDCKTLLSAFSIDVIASAAFGTKLSSLDDPNNEFVKKARQTTNADASYLIVFFFAFPSLVRFLKIDPFGGTIDFFRDFASHVIKQREKQNVKSNDFLQLLMDAQRGELEVSSEDAKEASEESDIKILPKHKTMSLEEMMAQCTLFLFAGSETTTNTLSFVLYYLALNPECQDKLIQEVDETFSSEQEMNFDVLNKMQYLDAVINETLRKEPIAIQLMRECTEEYEISEIGFKIPKGMSVVVPVYAMHHDPYFYPNPEKFDPERFMPENRNSIPQYAYLPFGEGPRNCIGMRFAVMVLKMCIVHFFREFRVLATEETKKPLDFFKGQGIIQPKKVMVKIENRK